MATHREKGGGGKGIIIGGPRTEMERGEKTQENVPFSPPVGSPLNSSLTVVLSLFRARNGALLALGYGKGEEEKNLIYRPDANGRTLKEEEEGPKTLASAPFFIRIPFSQTNVQTIA